MELRFWGVRGTFPVSDRNIRKYGGNTPCASLRLRGGEILIVDAGTGLKKLGERLLEEHRGKRFQISLFLTHFHLDHIIGFPFFGPLFSPNFSIDVFAHCSSEETEYYLKGLMAGRYFPLKFEETPSKKTIRSLDKEPLRIATVEVFSCPLHHPQGSVALKFQEGENSAVFATDTEHPEDGCDEKLASFARESEILVYDAMFTPEEYEKGRKGWGHSTWLAGTKIAQRANVQNLYLSHFNPDHPDDLVDEIVASAKKEFPCSYGAREGLVIKL